MALLPVVGGLCLMQSALGKCPLAAEFRFRRRRGQGAGVGACWGGVTVDSGSPPFGELTPHVGRRRSSQNFGQEIKRRSGGNPVFMRPGGPLPPVKRHRIEGNNEKSSGGISSRVGKQRAVNGSRPGCCRSIVMATSGNNGKSQAGLASLEHYCLGPDTTLPRRPLRRAAMPAQVRRAPHPFGRSEDASAAPPYANGPSCHPATSRCR